jgi:hypothetical protein
MYRNSILALVFTCTIAPAAQAARLTEVEGNVLVNKGDGFWEVNGATAVSAGDRVLVRGKGAAKIDYGNGCVKKISANQSTVVTSKPVCDPAPVVAQKQPVAKVAGSLKEAPAAPGAIEGRLPDHHAAMIGGVMAVATGAVLLASQGDDGDKAPKGGNKKDEVPAPTDAADVAAMVDTMASAAAAVPLDMEVTQRRITVVDSMVVAKTEAAATALDGGDTTDGSPASP